MEEKNYRKAQRQILMCQEINKSKNYEEEIEKLICLLNEKKQENKVEERIEDNKEKSIEDTLNMKIKQAVQAINCKYYVKMQPKQNQKDEDYKVQEKYIKKYDKLQSILVCSEKNKRAKMELVLVLMNEGYSQNVQEEFPKQYEYIIQLVEEYKKKTKTAKEVRQEIDEYCL